MLLYVNADDHSLGEPDDRRRHQRPPAVAGVPPAAGHVCGAVAWTVQ